MLKKLKSLFIVEEEGGSVVDLNKSKQSTKGSTKKINSQNSTSKPKLISPNSAGAKKFNEILLKALENAD